MTVLTLREARRKIGMTAQAVAEACDVDRATLYRIESAARMHRRETARALFNLYNGEVPLISIYDPEFAGQISPA